MTFVGSIASPDLVWNLADLFMAFLVLTNISSIVRMGRTAGLALDDYIKQRKAGIETPVFNRSVLNHSYGIVWWVTVKLQTLLYLLLQWKIQWKNKIYSLMRPVKVSFIGLFVKVSIYNCKNYDLHLTPGGTIITVNIYISIHFSKH